MNILVTGGTGFIGRPLCVELTKQGHKITIQSRDPSHFQASWELPSNFLKWNMEREDCPVSLDSFDAIIHLAGASIAGWLWTPNQKKKILGSRIASTHALGRALAKRLQPLPCFIAAAAIGIYPSQSHQTLDEQSAPGLGFLPEVCQAWESAVVSLPNVKREVRLRFGLVLGDGGGYLGKLLLPARLGLGMRLGDGEQWLSWVHRDDVLGVICQALITNEYRGPINVVAPEPVKQKDFQSTLARLLGTLNVLKAPAHLLRLFLGDFSQLLLADLKVRPRRLEELGFNFRYRSLADALLEAANIHSKNGVNYVCHRLEAVQYIEKSVPEVFAFFSDPHNLEKITPHLLNFKIKAISSKAIDKATLIDYQLKIHGIPLKWKSLIKEWRVNSFFVDNQEQGPYSIWHHSHAFFAINEATLMTDRVLYRLPFNNFFLGDLFALALVKRDIRKIFFYRRQVIEAQFPAFSGGKQTLE